MVGAAVTNMKLYYMPFKNKKSKQVLKLLIYGNLNIIKQLLLLLSAGAIYYFRNYNVSINFLVVFFIFSEQLFCICEFIAISYISVPRMVSHQ